MKPKFWQKHKRTLFISLIYVYGLIRYKNSYGFGVDMLRALIYAAAHFLHMCKIYGKITRA